MRLSCTLAAGALAAAAVPSCAFHVSGPAFVPTSAKTSFTSTSPVVGRHAAATTTPARVSRNVLQASVKLPGMDWARGRKERKERANSALVLKAGADAAAPAPAKEATSTLKVGFYLFVWYTLTIGYNIYNKATLNRMNIPWILSTVQLAVGTVYVSLVWALGVRKAPKLSGENLKAVLPLAALHTTSHIAAVVGLSAGAIGFVQIVKVRPESADLLLLLLLLLPFAAGQNLNLERPEQSRAYHIYQQQVRAVHFFFFSVLSLLECVFFFRSSSPLPPTAENHSRETHTRCGFFSGALVSRGFMCPPVSFACASPQQRQALFDFRVQGRSGAWLNPINYVQITPKSCRLVARSGYLLGLPAHTSFTLCSRADAA